MVISFTCSCVQFLKISILFYEVNAVSARSATVSGLRMWNYLILQHAYMHTGKRFTLEDDC